MADSLSDFYANTPYEELEYPTASQPYLHTAIKGGWYSPEVASLGYPAWVVPWRGLTGPYPDEVDPRELGWVPPAERADPDQDQHEDQDQEPATVEPAALDWDQARALTVDAILDRVAETLELAAPAPETADRPEDAPEPPTPSPQASLDSVLWSHTMRNPANRAHTLGAQRAQGNGRLRVRDSLDAVVKKAG